MDVAMGRMPQARLVVQRVIPNAAILPRPEAIHEVVYPFVLKDAPVIEIRRVSKGRPISLVRILSTDK